MEKKYRALGTLAGLFKVIAWLVLAGGILATVITGALGVLTARHGASELLSGVPFLNQISGWGVAIFVAIGVLISAVLLFLYVMGVGEAIQVAMRSKPTTRETAMYRAGRGATAAPPTTSSWESTEPFLGYVLRPRGASPAACRAPRALANRTGPGRWPRGSPPPCQRPGLCLRRR